MSPFARWLLARGYRAQTVQQYDAIARRLLGIGKSGQEHFIAPKNDPERSALLRYVDFLEDPGKDGYLGAHSAVPLARHAELVAAVRALSVHAPSSRVARRRGEQAKARARSVSVPDDEWSRFSAKLAELDTPYAMCLEVLSETGLRVGDLLAVERSALRDAARSGRLRLSTKGGKVRILPFVESWKRLWAGWQRAEKLAGLSEHDANGHGAGKGDGGWWPTVGHWITKRSVGDPRERKNPEAGAGARESAGYQRLRRALAQVASATGMTGRVHLHRLRRTVGVQALRITRDTSTVQQMLGHANIQTTSGYLDEARPDDLAELHGRMRERFSGRKPAPAEGPVPPAEPEDGDRA